MRNIQIVFNTVHSTETLDLQLKSNSNPVLFHARNRIGPKTLMENKILTLNIITYTHQNTQQSIENIS